MVLNIIVLVAALVACNNTSGQSAQDQAPQSDAATKKVIRVATLIGPTGMGMVELMERKQSGDTALNYDFSILESPDALVGKIITGEVDIAAVPTNLALVLYNRTEGAVQLAAVNTLGVVYVLENGDSIHSVADLKVEM